MTIQNKELEHKRDLLYLQALSYHIPGFTSPFGVSEELNKYIDEVTKYLVPKSSQKEDFLQPIFKTILNVSEDFYIPQVPLSMSEEDFFPQKENPKKEDLIQMLLLESKKNKASEPKIFAENLYYKLQIYTSNLPEPTGNYPGVSFFDYSKILASLATCLYGNENDEQPFLLLRADVSGIQDYIFNIASKHAAKNLKGRSFYIRLLTDTILYKILWALDLYQSNIVYASGGNFMLMVPSSKQEVLEELIDDISKNLFAEHKTDISIVFGTVPLRKEDLGGEQLKSKIQDLFKIIDRKKKQKFKNGITDSFSEFFDPEKVSDVGGSTKRDAITGEEFEWDETAYWEEKGRWYSANVKEKIDADEDLFRKNTMQQIELGRNIKDVKYWIISAQKADVELDKEEYAPCDLGIYHYLVDENGIKKYKSFLNENEVTILKFKQPYTYDDSEIFGISNIFGFTFYGGNSVPTFEYDFDEENDEGKTVTYKLGASKTFNHLAVRLHVDKDGETTKAGRFSRLGVLRLDVDGLGWLFSEGLTKNNFEFYNLPTYAAISRNLDVFFMGYLNTIWEKGEWTVHATKDGEKIEKLKHSTQIIYSGGDDLFIVGRWDACIYFAKMIVEDFQKFTCQHLIAENHPELSLSGGVAMVTHKFPIIKGAELAEEAEKDAKSYQIIDSDKEYLKNAFTLWKPMHWQWDFEKVEFLKNSVLEFMKERAYQSIFQRMMRFYEMRQYFSDKVKDNDEVGTDKLVGRWKWLFIYNISRAIEQNRRNEKLGDFLKQVMKDVMGNTYFNEKKLKGNYDYFELLQIAIRWAELEYRTFNK